jgi:hypothetical protein
MASHFADDVRIMGDAGGAGISRPAVGLGGGAGDEIDGHKGVHAIGRVVGDLGEPDAARPGAAVGHFDRADHEDLP